MPDPRRSAAVTIACSGMLFVIAAHVAARAARDALFLTQFPVTSLPQMVLVAALVSLLSAVLMSTLLARRGPDRVVPLAFAGSGALYLVDWLLVTRWPPLGAVVLYLHLAATGGVVISGFWSLVNERFDPRSGKAAVARIGGFAALGGVIGGIAAHVTAPALGVSGLLWLLATLHAASAVCAAGVAAAGGRSAAQSQPTPGGASTGPVELLRSPLLLHMVAFVAVLAATEALLDYALKAEASARFGGETGLVRFFATFYTATGLAAFGLQSLLGQRVLERLGPAGALAFLPTAVLSFGFAATLYTRLATLALARGAVMALGGSLGRAGFELLYTPLPARTRRASKTYIDVGAQRLGEMAGAGLVLGLLAIFWKVSATVVVGVAVAASLVGLFLVLRIRRHYVLELGESLRSARATPSPEPSETEDDPADTLSDGRVTFDRRELMARLRELREGSEPAEAADEGARRNALLTRIEMLTSGDPDRVRDALAAAGPDPRLAAQALSLLGRFDVGDDALAYLRTVAERCAGQLADALLDPDTPALVRRRVPQAFAPAKTRRALEAVVSGLEDADFEVRLRCSRTAVRIARESGLSAARDPVLAAAERELAKDARSWERDGRRRAGDGAEVVLLEGVPPAALDRCVEHVFNLLALVRDPEMMRSALLGLYGGNANLRGTALEYLQAVVHDELWEALEPHLPGVSTPRAERRSHEDVADELLRTTRGMPGFRES